MAKNWENRGGVFDDSPSGLKPPRFGESESPPFGLFLVSTGGILKNGGGKRI